MVCSCQTLCSPSSSPKSFRQCSLEANWAQPGLRRIHSRKNLSYDCNSDWFTVWTPGKKSVYWDWDHQPVIYMKLLAECIEWEILMNALIFVHCGTMQLFYLHKRAMFLAAQAWACPQGRANFMAAPKAKASARPRNFWYPSWMSWYKSFDQWMWARSGATWATEEGTGYTWNILQLKWPLFWMVNPQISWISLSSLYSWNMCQKKRLLLSDV